MVQRLSRLHRLLISVDRQSIVTVAVVTWMVTFAMGCGGDPVAGGGASCATAADCAKLDDGNLCNGTYTCAGGTCVPEPTIISCPASPCMDSQCVPETGQCESAPRPNDTACYDSDPCASKKTCQAGECTGGLPTCPDDNNPCTTTTCNPVSGACSSDNLADFTECDDGDACTTDDGCLAGVCGGGKITCEQDANVCTVAVCDGQTGECATESVENATPCSDEDPCSLNDVCQDGECQGGASKCQDLTGPCVDVACDSGTGDCQVTPLADGIECDDGNPCTVVDLCSAGACQPGASPCTDPNDLCFSWVCDPAGGECFKQPVSGAVPCDDGDLCTTADLCIVGECKGVELTCADDNNPCTVEGCDGTGGCVSVPLIDGIACDDGDACTASSECVAGNCKESEPACADDNNPCTLDSCDPQTGDCSYEAKTNGAPCDDANPCTIGESCQDAKCSSGIDLQCIEDGNPCTIEECLPEKGGCTTIAASEGNTCDDGNACTQDTSCQNGTCGGGATVSCPTPETPCVVASCNPLSGCSLSQAADKTLCDDDDACTAGDLCQGGQCQGNPVTCEESSNPCVSVSCDSAAGCKNSTLEDATACDDNDACTSSTTCQSGECTSGVEITCPELGIDCSVNVCDPATGGCVAQNAPEDTLCEDNDACTTVSFCSNGACSKSLPKECPDDGNPCTVSLCLAGSGGCSVVNTAPGSACDDGNACTQTDACQEGTCVGTAPIACTAPSNPCYQAVCDTVTGVCELEKTAAGSPCDDGDVCSQNDACDSGQCVGTAIECTQSTAVCTMTSCDPLTGLCQDLDTPQGSACDDGIHCTSGEVCDSVGICSGAPTLCPDTGVQCTHGECQPDTGDCAPVNDTNGSSCEDGNPCTGQDYCLKAKCISGTASTCPTTGPCAESTCDPQTGNCSQANAADATPCNDENACTSGETCLAGNCVPGQATDCTDDGNPCTADACDPTTGQCTNTPLPDGSLCEDGSSCTLGDSCAGGQCVAGTSMPCTDSGNDCAPNVCNPQTGVCESQVQADASPCDDGSNCTSGDTCVSGQCKSQPVNCPDTGDDCTVALCTEDNGCSEAAAANGTACIKSACEVGATCQSGVCAGGQPVSCPEPTTPCQVAACTPQTGCTTQTASDGTVCDDSDACTDNEQCNSGDCQGQAVTCLTPSPCHVAVCDPDSGCINQVMDNGSTCDDGNPCTVGDTCNEGFCSPGQPKACGGDACQPETCVPSSGVCVATSALDGTTCDDGDTCTQDDACSGGVCKGGSPTACQQPAGECMIALCVPELGACQDFPAPNGQSCDDDSLCTTNDACNDGTCIGQAAVICPAPTGCLLSICEPTSGQCVPELAPDGAPCDDGDACQVGETCQIGQCGVGSTIEADCCTSDSECDDNTPCTVDSCAGGRCRHTLAQLPICIGRIVVAGQSDAEITILNATTLAELNASPIEAKGSVQHLAASPKKAMVLGAVPDYPFGMLAFDPFRPTASLPVILIGGGGQSVIVDDERGLIAVVQKNGALQTLKTDLFAPAVSTGALFAAKTGRPTLEAQTGRIFLPDGLSQIGVLDLDSPGALMPSTPWPIGGDLTVVKVDPTYERLFVIDQQTPTVHVLSALHGSGLPGDPLGGFGVPTGLDIDVAGGRLFISYPDASLIRIYDLSDLNPSQPPAVSVPGQPAILSWDPISERLLVATKGDNKLHVLDGTTFSPVAGSPVSIAAGPVDIVTVWNRPGRLVITEAMVNPSAVADSDGEWIEVHNPTSAAITLDGWKLATGASYHTISGNSVPVVQPGGYTVLCRKADSNINGGINCDYEYSGIYLSNSGLDLYLIDPNQVILPPATLTGAIPEGQSLALQHTGFNPTRAYNWAASAGTPGQPNTDVLVSE